MNPLEILRLALLVAHFVGLAAIVGPFLMQRRRRDGFVLTTMFVGAIVQITTGIGLIATRRLTGLNVIDEKMVVKFILAIVVIVLVIAARARQRAPRDSGDRPVRPLALGAGVAAMANIVVAVVWT